MKIKLKRLHEDAIVPTYGTKFSACLDLYAIEDVTFMLGDTKRIRSGWAFEIPEEYYVKIVPRSGLSIKNDLIMPNSPGTVDSDYRGEIFVYMKLLKEDWQLSIKKGDRFAQIEIKRRIKVEFEEVLELGGTDRGSGGFGSTGV